MDIGKPIIILLLGVLIWGVYSFLMVLFPGFFRDCFRTARALPSRSLLNGTVALAISLLAVFGAAFFIGGNRALFLGGLFAVFQIAGSAVGLVIIGSLGGVIDTEKRPCSALAVGIIITWLVRIFSADAAEILNLAVAIYGVGAVTLYFRGEAPEAPPEELPQGQEMPPAGAGELERKFRERRDAPPGTAGARAGSDIIWVFVAVAVVCAVFYAYKNSIRNIVSPDGAAGPAAAGQGPAPQSAAGEGRNRDLTSVTERMSAVKFPVIDLDARRWAYRIQGKEFTVEQLEGYSVNWTTAESYKKELFVRIRKLLAAGPVTPLTSEERDRLDRASEEANAILEGWRGGAP
ncbi:MAG: hypothetical protein KKH28_00130 [Elusimicrobia bacterium]|nr:hypothetical protein [Elusimicrobiota bacterium]